MIVHSEYGNIDPEDGNIPAGPEKRTYVRESETQTEDEKTTEITKSETKPKEWNSVCAAAQTENNDAEIIEDLKKKLAAKYRDYKYVKEENEKIKTANKQICARNEEYMEINKKLKIELNYALKRKFGELSIDASDEN